MKRRQRPAKPGTDVEVGDEIYVRFGNGSLKVEVVALLDTCRKEDAADMYRVLE